MLLILEKLRNRELPVQQALRTWRRERRGTLTKMERSYAEGISQVTELPLETIVRSKPFKRFREALRA